MLSLRAKGSKQRIGIQIRHLYKVLRRRNNARSSDTLQGLRLKCLCDEDEALRGL